MKRYQVVAIDSNNQKMNIYKDQRTFSSKSTARKHLEAFNFNRPRVELAEIEEVEIESTSDRLLGAQSEISRLNSLLMESKSEIQTALEFMDSMGWKDYEPSEPEYQCRKSLLDLVKKMD